MSKEIILKIKNSTQHNFLIPKRDMKNHELGVAMDQSDWKGEKNPETQMAGKEILSGKTQEYNLCLKTGHSDPWASFDLVSEKDNTRIKLTPQFDKAGDASGEVKNDDKINSTKDYARRNYVDSKYKVTRELDKDKFNYTYTITEV